MRIQLFKLSLKQAPVLALLFLINAIQPLIAAPAPFPLQRGQVVMTSFSAANPNGLNVTVIDPRNPGTQPLGQNWLAPMFHNDPPITSNPAHVWKAANLGEVFGVCLDASDPPNIYVTATRVYGNTPFGPAGAGGVYKLDGNNGAISTFASLPSGSASLGNICFDAARNQFFVSEMDTGLIYRLDSNGGQLPPAFDHGVSGRPNEMLSPISDNGTDGYTPVGRRVWGLQTYQNRLYYGVWNNSNQGQLNEIWSIGINSDGTLNSSGSGSGGARREISLPLLMQFMAPPVSDIAFSKSGRMLLAERSSPYTGRVMEYVLVGTTWLHAQTYSVGSYVPYHNSAGGVDYACNDTVFATGDGLIETLNPHVFIFGLQILPPGGNTPATSISTSYLIDINGITTDDNKGGIGDVAAYREDCACVPDCPTDKVVECDSNWSFDSPFQGSCTNYSVSISTVTNTGCPVKISRTWTLVGSSGNTNTCSQTVTVLPPITFLPAIRNNALASTYTSPNGNGPVTVTLGYTAGSTFAQFESAVLSSKFSTLFPAANNAWGSLAQTFRVIGSTFSSSGSIFITIDLSQYNNSLPGLIFGLYNIRSGNLYSLAAFDANNQPLSPLGWNLIGNDDDVLYPQASTHVVLDQTSGQFSTPFYQGGTESDAAFWHIPPGTDKIVITGTQLGNVNDYVGIYFAETAPTPPPLINCASNKIVQCATAWDFDLPTVSGSCSGTDAVISIASTVTNLSPLVCHTAITRTWRITDACGGTNTCSQTVMVADNIPPLLTCASNKIVNCGSAWDFDLPSVSDDCSGTNVTLTVLNTVTNQTCPLQITRRWQAVDGCGNMSECSQTVSLAGTAPITLSVSGQANIFGAGHTAPPNPGGGSAGIMPPGHTFPASPGQVLKFVSVTGTASMTDRCASSGADGYFNIAPTDISSFGGISGIRHDGASYLVGVFLGPNQPANPAPTRLDFRSTGIGTSFSQMSPELGQTFFIGDGLTGTGSGAIQQFIVPAGATRLFLGFADAPSYQGLPGAYQDNNGMLTATFEIEQPFVCSSDKVVACDAPWSFDPPTAGPCNGAAITNIVLNTVTNGLCPMTITRTWSVTDSCGHSNICSQTVTLAGPLSFFSAVYNNSSSSTYTSPSGNGQITATTLAGSGLSSIQNESVLWSSRFTSLFPTANNNWAADAQTVRMIGAGNFTITIDFTQYNLSPDLVFGFYNIRDQGTYSIAAFDSANVQIAPAFTWNFLGNDDDSLHPQASTHLALNPATGIFSTQFYQTGEHSDAAFWNQIPGNTAKIVITGALQQIANNQDGIAIYFAEPVCCPTNPPTPITICSTNKTVECGTSWSFDPPIVLSPCGGTDLSVLSTITNGVCPKIITRTWAVTDSCGNSNTCSQTVTIIDNTPPVLTCLTNQINVALGTNCQLVIPTIQPAAIDNCTPRLDLIYIQDPPAGTIVTGTCQVVTVTVMDSCNNATQCQVMVCGRDRTPPTIIGPKVVTATNCVVPNVFGLLSASDNCTASNGLIFTQSPLPGTVIAPGGNVITATVTDQAGNSSSSYISVTASGPNSFLDVMFNTGVDGNKVPLSHGAVDPHYTLGPVPAGTPTGSGNYNAPNAVVIAPSLPIWGLPPYTASRWIDPGMIDPFFIVFPYPVGNYTYTNQFVLPAGANHTTASISGRWAADNGATMYLNGLAPANKVSFIPTPNGFDHWTYFTASHTANTPFLPFPAVNKLYFVVTNTGGALTSLRVEFTNAVINCGTCAPPVILHHPGNLVARPVGGSVVLNPAVWHTPPLNIQWYHNNRPLLNTGHSSGVPTEALTLGPLTFAHAGVYHARFSNSCGETLLKPTLVTIGRPWGPWPWGWWNFTHSGKPLTATFGPDLVLVGTNHLGVSSGTTVDFNLPNIGGKLANVMHVPALARDTYIKLPLAELSGSDDVRDFTLIMDVFAPSSAGGSSIKIVEIKGDQSPEETVTLSVISGPAGQALRLSGRLGNDSINLVSSRPLLSDGWNRIALRSRMSANEASASGALTVYINGNPAGTASFKNKAFFEKEGIISILSSPNGTESEAFLSDLQFHLFAFTPEMIAQIGSPENGPMPGGDSSTPIGPGPRLGISANYATGSVNISWTGSGYLLQETSDLTGDGWMQSTAPFDQAEGPGGEITTTARINIPVNPVNDPTTKFYRLVNTR